MKWVNHEIVTGVIVYTATQDPLLACYGMAGSILPDRVEGNPRRGDYWKWRKRHRGWSHWPVLYGLLLGMLQKLLAAAPEIFGTLIIMGIYFCIGALLHIAEDAVCGKVPLLTPKRKAGVKLFTVGSAREYLFSIGIVLLCYIIYAKFMVE